MKHFNLVDFICNNNLNKRWSTVHESHTQFFLYVTRWTDRKIDYPWSQPEMQGVFQTFQTKTQWDTHSDCWLLLSLVNIILRL